MESPHKNEILFLCVKPIVVLSFCMVFYYGGHAVSQTDTERVPLQKLLRDFKRVTYEYERVEMAEELIAHDDPAVISVLTSHLNSPDRNLRMVSGYILAVKGMGQGLSVLVDEMEDTSERPAREERIRSDGTPDNAGQRTQDRYLAVHLLRLLKDPHSVRSLMRHLDDPEIDYIVVLALGAIGDKRVIKPLKQKLSHLDSDDHYLRVFTAGGLAYLDDPEGHKVLQEYMDNLVEGVYPWLYKRHAVEISAKLNDRSYIARYLKLLQDSQAEIRIAAARALVTLRVKNTINAIGIQMGKEKRDVSEDEHDVYEALRQAILDLRKQKI